MKNQSKTKQALIQELGKSELERKRAEEALRDREEELASIYKSAPLIMLLVDEEWKIRKTNAFTAKFVGRAVGDMINLRCGESLHCIHSLDASEGCGFGTSCRECTLRLTAINTIETGQGHHEVEASMSLYDGKKKRETIFLLSTARLTIKGQPMALVSIQDITERKQAEEALRESEDCYKRLAEGSPDIIWSFSGKRGTLYASARVQDILGYSSDYIYKNPWLWNESIHPDDRGLVSQAITDFAAGRDLDVEYRIKNAPGDWLWFHDRSIGRWVKDSEVIIDGISTHITDRKLAEEKLHASLREKETLLSEVHHRVKNNMQVISGLLDLQARSSGNPELTEMLNESQERIRSMAMIHEKLYNSKDFARIDLAGYVRTLSQELFQSYKINQWKIALVVQTDGEVYIDINKAIPCGLILNELISNVLKHAFPGGRQGKLQIIIRETKNTEIEIVVRDNGLGLPEDVDIHQPRTVGLYLVHGLVKNQIDGQIEVIRDGGTEFRIKFPL